MIDEPSTNNISSLDRIHKQLRSVELGNNEFRKLGPSFVRPA